MISRGLSRALSDITTISAENANFPTTVFNVSVEDLTVQHWTDSSAIYQYRTLTRDRKLTDLGVKYGPTQLQLEMFKHGRGQRLAEHDEA